MDNFPDTTKEQVIDYSKYRWLASSSLQKSLRRGRFDLAQQYLRFLWTHDQNYVTYRFGTILTEDVGIANIPLISEYLATKGAKNAIAEKGGLDFLLRITEAACESVKDRSSCDSAYIASYYNLLNENNRSLEEVFLDPTNHYIDRINASWSILGNHKFKNESLDFMPLLEEKKDNLEQYLAVVSQLVPNEVVEIVRNAHASQSENICLGVPVVFNAYQNELAKDQTSKKIQVGDTIEHIYAKEVTFYHETTGLEFISAGIDGHTREGKWAYNQFLKTKNSFSDYLHSKNIPEENHMLLFSHCMFRVEGHEVNKRLYFPTAVQIMRDCESAILNSKAGTNPDYLDFSILKKSILESLPVINKMRENQLMRSPIPMMDKPEPKVPKKPKVKKITV